MQIKEIAILKNNAPEGFMVGDVVTIVEIKLNGDEVLYRVKNRKYNFTFVRESDIASTGVRMGSSVKVKSGAHNLKEGIIGVVELVSEYPEDRKTPWMVKVQGEWLTVPEFEVVEF